MKPRPRLVCIPSADVEFTAAAAAVLAEIEAEGGDEEAMRRFQRLLRRRYPTCVVRPREHLAETPLDSGPVWYVSRLPFRSRLSASVEIAAPPELVFDVYSIPERIREWQTAVEVIPTAPTTQLIGSEYVARYRILGRQLEGRFRVADAERPTYLRTEGEGMGIRVWYASTLRPIAGGTRVDVEGDYDLPIGVLGRAIDRLLIERIIQGDVERAHESLRAHCESLARAADGESAGPIAARG